MVDSYARNVVRLLSGNIHCISKIQTARCCQNAQGAVVPDCPRPPDQRLSLAPSARWAKSRILHVIREALLLQSNPLINSTRPSRETAGTTECRVTTLWGFAPASPSSADIGTNPELVYAAKRPMESKDPRCKHPRLVGLKRPEQSCHISRGELQRPTNNEVNGFPQML